MTSNQNDTAISAQTLAEWQSENRDMVILDVLPESHFAGAHIPGAKNACVFEVVFPDKVAEMIDTGDARPIILYGADGGTSDADVAAAKLQRKGYAQVLQLSGGLQAWLDAGFDTASAPEDPDAAAPAVADSAADGSYLIDTGESTIEWAGRNPNGKHFGTVNLKSGTVDVAGDRVQGDFEINMTSIVNTDLAGDEYYQVLIDHLSSDDFFFVERFPTARFRFDHALPLEGAPNSTPNYRITGAFELVGVKKALSFPALITVREDGSLVAQANFDLDRTQWGIIYGSSRFFKHLGMHLVFDVISIDLRIVTALRG